LDCASLQNRIQARSEQIQENQKKLYEAPKSEYGWIGIGPLLDTQNELQNATDKNEEDSKKLDFIKNTKFGVVLSPDLIVLKEQCLSEITGLDVGPLQFPVYFGDASGIKIADTVIKFKRPDL
jgi:hypothetical protein